MSEINLGLLKTRLNSTKNYDYGSRLFGRARLISDEKSKIKTEHAKEMINENEHIQVVRQSTRETINCCFECLSETDFIAVTEAARFIESDAPTIFRLTDAGVLHSLPAAGEVLVCLASLMRFEANRFH